MEKSIEHDVESEVRLKYKRGWSNCKVMGLAGRLSSAVRIEKPLTLNQSFE